MWINERPKENGLYWVEHGSGPLLIQLKTGKTFLYSGLQISLAKSRKWWSESVFKPEMGS